MKRAGSPAAALDEEHDSLPQSTPFPYRDYVAARHRLEAAIRGRPFYAIVTGLSGMGKTSLVHDLSATLDRHRHHLVYVSASKASLLGLSRFFAQVCHVMPRRSSLETTRVLADALKSQPTAQLVWMDEADQLPTDTLAGIRILAEGDLDVPQMFSIVFSGLPDLAPLLASPPLFPLQRRIGLRLQLHGLGRDELDAFLGHRFGNKHARRLPAALHDELFERTHAAPALLDKVVHIVLEQAGKEVVTDEHLREAFDAAGL